MDEEGDEQKSVSYFKLYRFASTLDLLLVLFGTIGAIAHGFSYPITILQFGRINNAFGTSIRDSAEAYRQVTEVFVVIVYIGVGIVFASALETTCWMLAGENITSKMKMKYLQALLSQDVSFYDMNVKTGDIVTAISSDMILIHDAVGEKVGAFIHSLSVFLSGIIICLVTFWRMGLLGMTATPLLLGAGGLYMALYAKFSARTLSLYQAADLITEQALSQIRTVYSFTGESKTLSIISKLLQQAVKLSTKTGLSKGVGMGFIFTVLYLSWALQFWYAGTVIRHGSIKAGTLYSLILISLFSGRALGDTLQLVDPVAKGQAAAVRLFQVIERKTKIDSSQGEVPEMIKGGIELRDVTFAYPSRPELPVFNGLTLDIPQGKIVALVGPSGSGKSSIVSLIQRFYDPQSGEVKIGGLNIKTLQLQWLRKQIGLVSQEPALFAATIEQNILLGMPGASREELLHASKLANADEFIAELPEAYNTQVGDRGLQLSGGQKQRIAIARAILRKPCVLLLDEATSALDSQSEFLVQKALDKIMNGQTTIIIAHRLSTIRNADKIIVLDNGRVAETGTHECLLSQGQIYAALVQTQVISVETSDVQEETFKDSIDAVEASAVADKTRTEFAAQVSYISWFCHLIGEAWLFMILGNFGACISGLVTAVFPLIMANIVILFLKAQIQDANIFILGVLGVAAVNLVGTVLQHFFGQKSGARISRKIQELSLRGILRNEVGWFDLEENNGAALTARISSNATVVRTLISDTYNFFLQNSLALLLAIAISFYYQWKVAFVTVTLVPIQMIGTSITEIFRKQGLSGDSKNYYVKAAQLAGEAASNIRTVFSLGAEQSILAGFRKHLLDSKSVRLRKAIVMGFTYGVIHGLMLVSSGTQLWYGIGLVKKGSTTFEPVLKVVTVVNFTIVNCMELLKIFPDFIKGKLGIATMFQLATRRSEIDPETPAAADHTTLEVTGNIELDSVTFAYPTRPEITVLSSFSLKIDAGSTVALVGQSGSGKSSVLSLIQRFYDPATGRVLFDGKDIRSLNLTRIRQHIGYVQQEPVLFAVSIKENILFGKEGASEAEIIQAAKVANAHDFISGLPEGYDTQAGERGVQLSGGQKQRIAIARAVIKNPKVLLLDEATSALDTESERVVQQAIEKIIVGGNRSTIIVAHRLSTIQHADCIVVMENGSAVESGRHEELMKLQTGSYARLIHAQETN